MIWDIIEQSNFDKYFSDPNTTITQLLLDQNIITELKNQNPKLLQYLSSNKHQFMHELIDYIIILPQTQDSNDRCHKLPYISSQLLAIDTQLIYGQFFREQLQQEKNEYWCRLLSFLEGDAAGNEVLMGYFQKVINNLYAGNKVKTTRVVSNNLQRFVCLLPNGSIADILKKCLVLLSTPEGAVLQQRKVVLKKVIELFATVQQQIKSSCSDILSEVVAKFQAFSSGDTLLNQLLNSQTLLNVYHSQGSVSVNQFLTTLIKKSQQKIINEHDQSVPLFLLPEVHRQKIGEYLERETFNIRTMAKSTGFIVNQNRQTVRKSNKSLYSLLDLVRVVMDEGLTSFVDESLLSFLWNLVLLYPYNNILHVTVLKIFSSILSSTWLNIVNLFLLSYQSHLLSLAKNHLHLLKQFIYSIWKQTRQLDQDSNKQESVQYKQLVALHLMPLTKYEVVSRQQKHKSQHKLIVDEQDKSATSQYPYQQAAVSHTQQILHKPQWREQKQQVTKEKKGDFFGQFDIGRSQLSQSEAIKQLQADINFFNDWNIQNLQQSFQGKPKPPKNDIFNDFSTFF